VEAPSNASSTTVTTTASSRTGELIDEKEIIFERAVDPTVKSPRESRVTITILEEKKDI
jgi:hypothetical protein